MQFNQFLLDPRIAAGIKSAGFNIPTPIQQQAIPAILQKRDILGTAQTGTGKTAAFVLPILQSIISQPKAHIRALIVVPTRELAEQIHQTIAVLAKHTPIRSTTVYGGVSKPRQIEAVKRGVQIVVACPGRLLDLINERAIDLSHVDTLVLDESDQMCDMGFLPDVRRIIKHVPSNRQTLFFSATMPKEILSLAETILHNPTKIQIDMIAPAKTVSHALYPVPQNLKTSLVSSLLHEKYMDRVLIFTRTKHRAKNLSKKLTAEGFKTSALQGNMSQNARQSALDGFRAGKYDILVATDIAARGIDVSEISHVINFDMPDTVDAYIHRIGRTGRAEETGKAITFTIPEDEDMIRSIEKVLGSRIERKKLANFNYSSSNPQATVPNPNFQRTQQSQRPSRSSQNRFNRSYSHR